MFGDPDQKLFVWLLLFFLILFQNLGNFLTSIPLTLKVTNNRNRHHLHI